MPPLCKLGIRFDHSKGIFCAFLLGFMLEIGLNLSEDLFFFALHLILGEKSNQIWVKTFFIYFIFFAFHLILGQKSDQVKTFFFLLFTWCWAKNRTDFGRNNFWFRPLLFSYFPKFLDPSPFQNPAYATGNSAVCFLFWMVSKIWTFTSCSTWTTLCFVLNPYWSS